MPIVKAGSRLIYYAHVPKCGGSAVAWYLRERFGAVAFSDSSYTRHNPVSLWSRTSPQHIDTQSLGRLFPPDFFDAVFTIVRHPVPRLISAYHFQLEVEQSISTQVRFSDWLEDLAELRLENPFLYDNHVRPMSEIVPEGAQVFYMEHSLDGLIPWFDQVTGEKSNPRAIPEINKKGEYTGVKTARVQPSEADLALISEVYAQDFSRFGYDSVRPGPPKAPPPVLPPDFAMERDAALRKINHPLNKIKNKIAARLKA